MSKYTILDSKIYRDGEPVANYDANAKKLDFLEGMDRFRAPVVRFVNTLPLVDDPATASALAEPAPEEAAPIIAVKLGGSIKTRTYPDAPPFGEAGDKTPEFVEWLFKHHPEDAAIRYAGRKTCIG
jgi:hypothetical protein